MSHVRQLPIPQYVGGSICDVLDFNQYTLIAMGHSTARIIHIHSLTLWLTLRQLLLEVYSC